MAQTSMKYLQGIAYEGMVADTIPRVIRGAIEQFTVDVDASFGRVLVRKTAGSNILTLPTATGQKPVGIAVNVDMYGYSYNTLLNSGAAGYPAGSSVNVLTWGDIWVHALEGTLPDDPAFFNYKNGVGADDLVGRFHKAAVATQTDPFPNARFLITTNAAGLSLLNIGGA